MDLRYCHCKISSTHSQKGVRIMRHKVYLICQFPAPNNGYPINARHYTIHSEHKTDGELALILSPPLRTKEFVLESKGDEESDVIIN